MRAHGYLPGPTQRPVMAGLLSGAIAMIVSLPLLWLSGAAERRFHMSGIALWLPLGIYGLCMPFAGAVYGRIFMRAANDRRGGWLFGIGFGFLLWMIAATTGQIAMNRPLATGGAAQGVFAAHLLFGLALGIFFPPVHRLLQARLKDVDVGKR